MSKLVREMKHLEHSFDVVTILVDFYGFKGKERYSAHELEQMIRADIEKRYDWKGGRLMPYVQMHEFEGLLFSDVNAFAILPDVSQQAVRKLERVRARFATPEDINDSSDTAPSRCIRRVVPQYQKVVHGPMIAIKTGLKKIRTECPRFKAWLEHLETLQDRVTSDSV